MYSPPEFSREMAHCLPGSRDPTQKSGNVLLVVDFVIKHPNI